MADVQVNMDVLKPYEPKNTPFDITSKGSVYVVEVTGALNLAIGGNYGSPAQAQQAKTLQATAEKLEEEYKTAPKHIIFDMEGATKISSNGLGLFTRLYPLAHENGKDIYLINVDEHTEKVMHTTKLGSGPKHIVTFSDKHLDELVAELESQQ